MSARVSIEGQRREAIGGGRRFLSIEFVRTGKKDPPSCGAAMSSGAALVLPERKLDALRLLLKYRELIVITLRSINANTHTENRSRAPASRRKGGSSCRMFRRQVRRKAKQSALPLSSFFLLISHNGSQPIKFKGTKRSKRREKRRRGNLS